MSSLLASLRVRLLFLVLVAVVPALGILAYAARDQRRLLEAGVEQDAHEIARVLAGRNARAVERARGLLIGLSRLPSLRALDGERCSREVAPILSETDEYVNVGAVGLDGQLYCSAAAGRGGVNLRNRDHVRAALETGEFTVGRYLVTRLRGGVPAVGIALPVRGDDGRFVAVAIAPLDVRALQRDLEAAEVPERVSAVVVDKDGTIVALRPFDAALVGTRIPGELHGALLAHSDARRLPGLDGVERVFGFHVVRDPQGGVALRVAVGLPAADALAPVERIVRRSFLAFGIVALLALVAAGFAAEHLLVRKLRALMVAARRIAGGDYSARVGLAPGREELGQLISAFDEMARSLEALSRQNRLILDAVGEGIIGMDRDGRVIFANPAAARALGRTVEELVGGDGHALLHADGSPYPAPDCRILAAMREGSGRHDVDETFRRRDGSTFPAEFVASPLVDGGEIVGHVLAFRDVGERRRLEEQLRHAQKMEAVGQLAGGVAHDFNNLLTAIVSFARLVRETLPPGHESQPDLREIVSAADRAAALTRQLLAFSRRQRLAPRVIELAEVVRGMEPMLRRVVGDGVMLEVDVRAPGTVLADPGQLELAVLNLTVNARDAMPDGGRLVIAVDERSAAEASAEGAGLPGPVALLSVRDDGVGMDEATQARAFEPFFTTKPVGKGTGLGLATVHGIVSQSGGTIRVRSAPGQGSEFRIALPRHADETTGSPREAAGAGGGDETVLLVEDDPVVRAIARRTLLGAGYRVLDAPSAQGALAAAAALEGPLHLLVSDVILPGESGGELARELEASRPGLRVLFVSGYARRSPSVALVPSTAPFLAKPFAPEDLLRAVRDALDAPAGEHAA